MQKITCGLSLHTSNSTTNSKLDKDRSPAHSVAR